MKKIKVGDKVCANCGQFTTYYEMMLHNFNECGCGVCCLKNSFVKDTDACGNFIKKNWQPVSVKEVENALKNVEEIEKLLKELNATNNFRY